LNIYILTCDKYSHLIPGFCFLFNKFYGEEKVTILYYNTIPKKLPSNFKCVSLGKKDNVRNWSGPLLNFFSKIKDEYFVLGLEDYWIFTHINRDLYQYLIDTYLKKNIAKICFDKTVEKYGSKQIDSFNGFPIFKAKQMAKYRTSLQFGIWRKDYFLKYLKPDISPWQFEIRGNRLARNDGELIIGANVINYNTVYVKKHLSPKAVKQLKNWNLFDKLKKKGFL
jgi:hypothetical protein